MAKHYFLGVVLPEIQVGAPLELTFEQLDTLLKNNLSARDYEKVRVIRRYFDFENLRAMIQNQPLYPYGNENASELEESWIAREGFPDYAQAFFYRYPTKDEVLKHIPELISLYFSAEGKVASGFLKWYLTFERELRLVLAGFRAKKLGRDVIREFQYENPEDDIVAQILAQKDHKTYEPPEAFSELKTVFNTYQNDPLGLFQSVYEFIFRHIDEKVGEDFFSTDYILAYVIKYILAARWLDLDQQKGSEIMDKLLKDTK